MIVVFGSVNIDLTFQLAALPSVGETVLTPKFTETIGGKGANQAVAAKRVGAEKTRMPSKRSILYSRVASS